MSGTRAYMHVVLDGSMLALLIAHAAGPCHSRPGLGMGTAGRMLPCGSLCGRRFYHGEKGSQACAHLQEAERVQRMDAKMKALHLDGLVGLDDKEAK